eukprot:TRINITY_DN120_c0_g1_i6.p1 TRINITY_DN120_c0_g1~~TRINITY_DN120_c0_g1_i6.p1  ORF type:complete len:247 (-),score=57.73 TRINITY_DN120_c0_g1_i6:139-879(-)
MNDVEVNNLALVEIVRQVAEGRDNDGSLILAPIPLGPNAAAIRPMLLQNRPGCPPKPAGMNVATYEMELRIQETENLLASHNRAYQQQSLLKLRQSLLALPAKVSVEYDPSDSGVLAAFEELSKVIFRLDEVLNVSAEKGMTPEYEKERTDEITKEFLDALRKCAIAVKKAHEVYKARFVGGIVTGVAATIGAVAAAPIAVPVAAASALIATGGFIFATVSGNAKSQTEEIGLEVQVAERAQSRRN